MYAIVLKDIKTGKTWLYKTAFNSRIPEVVTFDTIEQVENEIEVIRRVSNFDRLNLEFAIIKYKTV